jgi:predicted transcriptional regulator
MPVSTTIRLDDPQTLDKVDDLARAMDRSRNWVLNRAIDDYVHTQSWQLEKIRAGLAAADRGDFASEADVQRVLTKHRRPE